MLRAIGLAIVALVFALAVYIATRPDSFRVERTVTINAPADRIYPLIADFHAWPRWSPWEGMIGEQFDKGLATLKQRVEG